MTQNFSTVEALEADNIARSMIRRLASLMREGDEKRIQYMLLNGDEQTRAFAADLARAIEAEASAQNRAEYHWMSRKIGEALSHSPSGNCQIKS